MSFYLVGSCSEFVKHQLLVDPELGAVVRVQREDIVTCLVKLDEALPLSGDGVRLGQGAHVATLPIEVNLRVNLTSSSFSKQVSVGEVRGLQATLLQQVVCKHVGAAERTVVALWQDSVLGLVQTVTLVHKSRVQLLALAFDLQHDALFFFN